MRFFENLTFSAILEGPDINISWAFGSPSYKPSLELPEASKTLLAAMLMPIPDGCSGSREFLY